jgi:adenosine deaminase
MSALLVTTLGQSWAVVPELYGFTNPADLDLYACSPDLQEICKLREDFAIKPVSEIWVVTTEGTCGRNLLAHWAAKLPSAPTLRIWVADGVEELRTAQECRSMAELIYRVVLLAREHTASGHLYLSLAGGRKTMSADMQQAARVFGCDALLHVAMGVPTPGLKDAVPPIFLQRLTVEDARELMPLVVAAPVFRSPVILVQGGLKSADYSLPLATPLARLQCEPALLLEVERRERESRNLLFHFAADLGRRETQSSFRALYAQDPDLIERLHSSRIGVDASRQAADLAWLRSLPKAELHCHLGGILSPAEMVRVAQAAASGVRHFRRASLEFDAWLGRCEQAVAHGDLHMLEKLTAQRDFRGLRTRFAGVREPYAVAGFLGCFEWQPAFLDELIYGQRRSPEHLCGAGIEAYERLGDLQGSGLLQCEETLRATCRILAEQCKRNLITYLELRCSPANYTRGGLEAGSVVEVLLDGIEGIEHCAVRLIFIASRHRDVREAQIQVELALELLDTSERFCSRFVGFDLAGDEAASSPKDMREVFMPMLARCQHLTIHAGETADAESIWQAVYHLSADRIGHGLTLRDRSDLMGRFTDRRIGIEMCPSSNFQIVGYRDYLLGIDGASIADYPLRTYLDRGLRVTLNTDNPGISRTTLSNEYSKAAAMTLGGLSRWEVLQLVRNGFRAAFCAPATRRERLLDAEQQIVESLLAEPVT